MRLGTGVTCPLIRIHPAVIAHASATAAALMPGRFFLGLGTGENLNEHVLGDRWPEGRVRFEMLVEAIEVIRLLWEGGYQSHHGTHYTVEQARLYTLPDEPPPIMVAAGKSSAATLAATAGDGFIGTAPDEELLAEFDAAGGGDKPPIGQLTVCWAGDEASGEEDRARVVAERRRSRRARPGARAARALRAGRRARLGGRRRRDRRLRPGPRCASRGDPGVRRRRLRPRLRPPGRARPGGFPGLLPSRDPQPALTLRALGDPALSRFGGYVPRTLRERDGTAPLSSLYR